jgi:signal transduction histidine kinase
MILRLIFFLLTALLLQPVAKGESPRAEKGVIDLRTLSGEGRFLIKLNGDWEFYWGKMYHPYDFKVNDLKPDYYGHIPSYWTDYPQEIIKTTKEGYATYRLKILLPQGFREPLGFDIPVFDSSYDLYLNDQYIDGNGVPGRSAAEEVPEYRKVFFRHVPLSDSITVLINVSNFNHRRGGFWLPMRIGTFSEVQRPLANSWASDWAIISLLIGFSLFFLFFYIINPQEKVMGYFAVATIGLALRPLFTSNFLINTLSQLSWVWIVRFEYLSLYLTIIGWYWFLDVLYPNKYFKLLAYPVAAFFIIAFIATPFIPVKLFSYTTVIFYPAMLILMIWSIVQSIIGILRKNYIDIAYFSAFLLLVIGGVHDIRVSLGRSESSIGYILTYLVVIFVFIQAALLLYKWVKAFHEKDKLKNELEYMNRNLEQLVDDRTQELIKRNEDIERQNQLIATQNKQLSDTIQLKNKMFSLVAHDLRSPVVNILYMLNLLKEKEYKERYDTFANSSIEYAQRVISLLENMLVWGRGQEDKIKFSPEKLNVADIILTNLSIFKESADKKDISVNFTQIGSTIAFIDKDLLDIIIRNILSNAIKYTPRGGRISILLKNRSADGLGMLLKICDNGTGIPVSKQKNIFTSDFIESTPGTENEKGTGLGLKLVHELVLINRGSIEVESREGEGTCFSITLPEQ